MASIGGLRDTKGTTKGINSASSRLYVCGEESGGVVVWKDEDSMNVTSEEMIKWERSRE
jgi:hypothetical protein